MCPFSKIPPKFKSLHPNAEPTKALLDKNATKKMNVQ